MGGRFRCFQRSGELLRAQMSNFNLRRCSISTCFFLASSFRAQMFNFNLLLSGELISGPDVRVSGELLWAQLLESSYGPRFPNSTCVWRAHSGPRCLNLRLASSSRAQTSIDLRRKRKMANGANTCAGRGRRLPPRSSAAFASRGVGCYSERVEDVPRRRTIENHKFILELSS